MVEKDTGRSRGFGFVSYDSPDAAALAIKELNGFPVSYYVGRERPRMTLASAQDFLYFAAAVPFMFSHDFLRVFILWRVSHFAIDRK